MNKEQKQLKEAMDEFNATANSMIKENQVCIEYLKAIIKELKK